MSDIVISVLLLTGASFLLLASIGLVRMPDLYTRIQTSAKGSTLGVGFVVLALAAYFNDFSVTVRALLVSAFLILTAPVSGHVIGRAAYFIGVPLWKKSVADELKGRYNVETHELENPEDLPLPPLD
jgi:multicomponent Na+:H+ antiporter subunit G